MCFKISLETSGKDRVFHSFRVYFTEGTLCLPIYVYLPRLPDLTVCSSLVSSVVLHLLHSFRVWFASSPPVSSVVSGPERLNDGARPPANSGKSGLHSKRVEKMQNYTRNE